MLITVKSIDIEKVTKGKAFWNKATVAYEDEKGQARTKYLVSFANKSVFEVLNDVGPGTKLNVTVTKNDKDEWDWAKAEIVNSQQVASAKAAPASGKVVGSNYETPEERAKRQLMIVRQSSISNAIEYLKSFDRPESVTPEDVLEVAQVFVDFVYGNDKALGKMDSETQDIPY